MLSYRLHGAFSNLTLIVQLQQLYSLKSISGDNVNNPICTVGVKTTEPCVAHIKVI